MKKYILICLVIFADYCNAQQWITIDSADLGIFMAGQSYIEVDKNDNSIWFGNGLRLYHLKDGLILEEIVYPTDSGPADLGAVKDLVIIDGVIWGIDDMEGLFKYEGGVFTIVESTIKVGYSITVDDDDSLWIATSAFYGFGYYGYKDGNYFFFTTGNSDIENNDVHQVLNDSYDRMWISYLATYGYGITRYEEGVMYFMNILNSNLPTMYVRKTVESPTNDIWIATLKGICRYDEVLQDWIVYDKQNTNMPAEWVSDIQFDSQGRMWALFKDTALAYTYNFTDWTIFDETNSPITPDEINTFTIDTLDQIWVGGLFEMHVLTLDSFSGWLSVTENEIAQIGIYPNPANDQITINGFEENSEIEILNMQGKIVYHNQSSNSKTIIDVSQFERGIYLVRVSTIQGVITRKIVLQ